jgi:hypothetical protein
MLKRISKWTYGRVKSNDKYATTISMTFEGHSKFKTFYGGFVSLALNLVLLIFTIAMISSLFQRSLTDKSSNYIVKDLSSDTTKHYIGKSTFAFALRLTGPNPGALLDKSYFSLKANVMNYSRFNQGYNYTSNAISIELEL